MGIAETLREAKSGVEARGDVVVGWKAILSALNMIGSSLKRTEELILEKLPGDIDKIEEKTDKTLDFLQQLQTRLTGITQMEDAEQMRKAINDLRLEMTGLQMNLKFTI